MNGFFPSAYKANEPLSRKWAYQLIEKIGVEVNMEIYPHWFRSQRASQFASEYEMTDASILEWFQWTEWATASRYCKLAVGNG